MDANGFVGRPDAQDLRTLRQWARSTTLPHRLVLRSRIVLLALDGASIRATALQLHVSSHTVSVWRKRFREGGLDALTHDAPGRGRKPRLSLEALRLSLEAIAAVAPPAAARREHSVRSLAERLGVSKSTVHRALDRRH